MSIWDSLRGHAEQREMFRRTLSRNRLSQAYLFLGLEGIGKQEFAQRLSHALLCQRPGSDPTEPCGECSSCQLMAAGTHPDFLYIGCPPGKRELPIALLVGPEDKRGREGLCHDLALAPLPGSRKVAIVDDADTMNEASANSFLKTLEEPPDRAVLILIASNLDALLPTIRSRCQLIRFSSLAADDVKELLIQQNLVDSESDAQFAASLSEGSLTVAGQLLETELRQLRSQLYSQFTQSNVSGVSMMKLMNEGLGKISTDPSDQRQNSQWLIRFAAEFFRATLRQLASPQVEPTDGQKEVANFAARLRTTSDPIDAVGRMLDRSIEAAIHLDRNVPVALCLESLFDDLARSIRVATQSRS